MTVFVDWLKSIAPQLYLILGPLGIVGFAIAGIRYQLGRKQKEEAKDSMISIIVGVSVGMMGGAIISWIVSMAAAVGGGA